MHVDTAENFILALKGREQRQQAVNIFQTERPPPLTTH